MKTSFQRQISVPYIKGLVVLCVISSRSSSAPSGENAIRKNEVLKAPPVVYLGEATGECASCLLQVITPERKEFFSLCIAI